jgi:hypothetical protein
MSFNRRTLLIFCLFTASVCLVVALSRRAFAATAQGQNVSDYCNSVGESEVFRSMRSQSGTPNGRD